MAYSECCHEKLSPYKIIGQAKPFIDKNLQLQLPGLDHSHHSIDPSSSIYSHYVGTVPSYLLSQINETELYNVIKEAEHSYGAWKHMQQQLLAAVKDYQS